MQYVEGVCAAIRLAEEHLFIHTYCAYSYHAWVENRYFYEMITPQVTRKIVHAMNVK